jgi:large subunit GTPase 1
LEEFIHTTELARARYDAERPETYEESMVIVGNTKSSQSHVRSKYEIQESASRILRRPEWDTSMSATDIKAAEDAAFLDWRRNLAHLEEVEGVVLSPFERNVDFWRQLWRTVERSDIVVQIVDARDPLFFLSKDLFQYVSEVAKFQNRKKNCVLLINKSDFVPDKLRHEWSDYFRTYHPDLDVVNFSALREIGGEKKETEDGDDSTTHHVGPVLGDFVSGNDIVDADTLIDLLVEKFSPYPDVPITVGMVGFPNVGKSSVINALMKSKKVSASSTPGKTKHIQTIQLNDSITLCDCPGIVLPSVVSSKAHLVVNATMPLDHLRGGALPAIELVVERMGFRKLLQMYKCEHALLPQFSKLGSDARAVLSAIAVAKKYFLALNVPDETKAARLVLKDVCSGKIVHVMEPPGSSLGADLDLIEKESIADSSDFVQLPENERNDDGIEEEEEDLEDDIAGFLMQHRADEDSHQPRELTKEMLNPPTKRAMRMGSKKEMKSKNKFCGSTNGSAKTDELVNRISALKPGGRGRVSKALADPYGCHASNEL